MRQYRSCCAGTTTTHGAAFDQWYGDTAAVNRSAPLTITLENTITPDPEVHASI